jgi:hypothetical protein
MGQFTAYSLSIRRPFTVPICCLFLSIHCHSLCSFTPLHCLFLSIHCPFAAIHCLFLFSYCPTPIHLTFPCLFTAYSLPIPIYSLANQACSLPIFFLFTAYFCLCTAHSLPIHCLFTVYSVLFTLFLPIHCRYGCTELSWRTNQWFIRPLKMWTTMLGDTPSIET